MLGIANDGEYMNMTELAPLIFTLTNKLHFFPTGFGSIMIVVVPLLFNGLTDGWRTMSEISFFLRLTISLTKKLVLLVVLVSLLYTSIAVPSGH